MESDRFRKWALTADVAGAIAVVVTLVFLLFEMRGNTNAVQAQTYQVLMRELADYRKLRIEQWSNPEYVRIEDKLAEQGWLALTRAEQRQMRLPAIILWSVYESAYFAKERGVLGEGEWVRFQVGICRAVDSRHEFWDPGGGETPMADLLTPDFLAYVEDSC